MFDFSVASLSASLSFIDCQGSKGTRHKTTQILISFVDNYEILPSHLLLQPVWQRAERGELLVGVGVRGIVWEVAGAHSGHFLGLGQG